MSVTRLLLSGLLVTSGLILAAFTLHGAFDTWQVQASGAQGPPIKPWATHTYGASGRLVATSSDAPKPGLSKTPGRASPKPDGDPKADARARRKRQAEKRQAQKAQRAKQPSPQQAALQWPWNWFGN
jgi:hypothetical protein